MPFSQMLFLGNKELEVGNKVWLLFPLCLYFILSSSNEAYSKLGVFSPSSSLEGFHPHVDNVVTLNTF